jgi:hypothetical protein
MFHSVFDNIPRLCKQKSIISIMKNDILHYIAFEIFYVLLWSVEEEWGIELSDLKGSRTPQKDLQRQQTWPHGDSRRLKAKERRGKCWNLVPYTFVADAQIGIHIVPYQLEWWLFLTQ